MMIYSSTVRNTSQIHGELWLKLMNQECVEMFKKILGKMKSNSKKIDLESRQKNLCIKGEIEGKSYDKILNFGP